MTNDKLQQLDNKLRELRKELEDDLLKYNSHYPDEHRLINDAEYCRRWITGEIEASSKWFMEEIYK